jgi:hypothetical protein
MSTVKLAPDLYTKPPKTAVPGARVDYRSYEAIAGDVASTTQILGVGILPAGHRLANAALEMDALDSNATGTLTASVGVLNSYLNQALPSVAVPASYNSGGTTDVNTTSGLVSGQNIFTASTIGRAGGRTAPSLAFSDAIGVDFVNDRIIGVQFPAAAATAAAGTIGLILTIDQD